MRMELTKDILDDLRANGVDCKAVERWIDDVLYPLCRAGNIEEMHREIDAKIAEHPAWKLALLFSMKKRQSDLERENSFLNRLKGVFLMRLFLLGMLGLVALLYITTSMEAGEWTFWNFGESVLIIGVSGGIGILIGELLIKTGFGDWVAKKWKGATSWL